MIIWYGLILYPTSTKNARLQNTTRVLYFQESIKKQQFCGKFRWIVTYVTLMNPDQYRYDVQQIDKFYIIVQIHC